MEKPLRVLADWINAIPREIKEDIVFLTVAFLPREIYPKSDGLQASITGFPEWLEEQCRSRSTLEHTGLAFMLCALLDATVSSRVRTSEELERSDAWTRQMVEEWESEGRGGAESLRRSLEASPRRNELFTQLHDEWTALRQGGLSVKAIETWNRVTMADEMTKARV